MTPLDNSSHSHRIRLDHLLVLRGLFPTRSRAQAALLAGEIWVDGIKASKAGTLVSADAALEHRPTGELYVSRGGRKLEHALSHFGIEAHGLRALDIGSSTGGFTDCLLARGARHVVAVDVGKGLLDWRLRRDPRVTLLEGVNARFLSLQQVGEPCDLAVVDVSFISLRLILPVLPSLLVSGASVVPLVKPQFEVGKGEVGKGGVVRESEKHKEVLLGLLEATLALGLNPLSCCASPLLGPKGNREFFLHLRKDRGAKPWATLMGEVEAALASRALRR